MSVIDTVTISADGDYVPVPSGSDTTTIIVNANQKHVYFRPPASTTNGRPMRFIFESTTSDAILTIDKTRFGVIDPAYKQQSWVLDGNQLIIDAVYLTASGAVEIPQWSITAIQNVRSVTQHSFSATTVSFTGVISNAGWLDSLGGTTQLATDAIATGLRANADATLRMSLASRAAPMNFLLGSVFIEDTDNGAADEIELYVELIDMSRITVTGTPFTIGVSVDGGAAQVTADIASSANDATIKSAIEALPNVGAGNVFVRAHVPSTIKEIVFSPLLGATRMTATNATVGISQGEQLVWNASGTADPLADTPHWLVPVDGLIWKPTNQFDMTMRADMIGADTTGAFLIAKLIPGVQPDYAIGNYEFVFTGDTATAWTIGDQNQFPDFLPRDTRLDYINAGTAALTLTAPVLTYIRQGGNVTSSLVLQHGETVRLIPDGIYWNAVDGMSFTSTDRTTLTGIADVISDADGVETGWSFKQVLRLLAAFVGGKSRTSGGVRYFRNLGDTKDVMYGPPDRSSVTRDVT